MSPHLGRVGLRVGQARGGRGMALRSSSACSRPLARAPFMGRRPSRRYTQPSYCSDFRGLVMGEVGELSVLARHEAFSSLPESSFKPWTSGESKLFLLV